MPVQPAGILFYRAKNFYRRNVWTLIFQWGKNANGNLFRFIVRHVHSSTVGRTENCNLLVAHVQYIGPDSMASKYAYRVSEKDCYIQEGTKRFVLGCENRPIVTYSRNYCGPILGTWDKPFCASL